MPCVRCLCGARLDAADGDALCDTFFAHTDEVHSQIKVTELKRREVADAIRRTGGWDGQRLRLDGEVVVRPLVPALADDYLQFFDHDAFPDNPVWASCYCIAYALNVPAGEFDLRSAVENRSARARIIQRGEASGVLAYADDRVVGWCHAAPRRSLPLLDRTPGFACDDPDHTGAIVCFVIPPQYRGQGVARRLLDGACEMFGKNGFASVEAYPPQRPPTDAASYHGRRQMYVAAGFEHVRDAGLYAVVRKRL